jgi:hypothetical protein
LIPFVVERMDARRIPKKCEKSFSWATGLTRRHEVVARSLSPRRKPPVQDLIDRPRTSLGTGRSLQARLRDHLQRSVAISRGERLRQKGLETRIVVQAVRAFLVYWGGPSHFRRGRAGFVSAAVASARRPRGTHAPGGRIGSRRGLAIHPCRVVCKRFNIFLPIRQSCSMSVPRRLPTANPRAASVECSSSCRKMSLSS